MLFSVFSFILKNCPNFAKTLKIALCRNQVAIQA